MQAYPPDCKFDCKAREMKSGPDRRWAEDIVGEYAPPVCAQLVPLMQELQTNRNQLTRELWGRGDECAWSIYDEQLFGQCWLMGATLSNSKEFIEDMIKEMTMTSRGSPGASRFPLYQWNIEAAIKKGDGAHKFHP